MSRRSGGDIRPIAFLVLGFAACCPPAHSEVAPRRADIRNVVFILVDDLGWSDLGCYGSRFHKTPHLDQLAASGTRFTDAYAACPVCSPTRAAIMTGQHPVRLNITDWIPGQDPVNRPLLGAKDLHALPLEQQTIAEALRETNYRTFFGGKWHLGGRGFLPEDQGFEVNKGGHHRGSPPGGYYSPYRNPQLSDGPKGEYLPDRLTVEAIRFLRSVNNDPFLLYLSFYTVHTPIQADRQSVAQFRSAAGKLGPRPAAIAEHDGKTRPRQDRPDYASMVFGMDRNVGRLLRALADAGLDQSTAIVFTSDNGGLSTLRGPNAPTCNTPLRAGKGWCYEGGIRVPLIVRAPGVTKSGSVCKVPVTSMDYYPTILELLRLESRPTQHADGVSLVAWLADPDRLPPARALYWHYPHYHGSMWKPGAAIRNGRWKLIEFYESKTVELYDLEQDLGERSDLSKTHPDRTRSLQARLKSWQKSLAARMPRPNPAYVAPAK